MNGVSEWKHLSCTIPKLIPVDWPEQVQTFTLPLKWPSQKVTKAKGSEKKGALKSKLS